MTATSIPPDSDAEPQELDAAEQLNRSFKATMAAVRRLRGRETQRPGDLSYAQYSLLFGLSEHAELSARDLAFAAELSPATVTQMLDSLEAHGLVKRLRSQRDKRVVLSSLTERGHKLVDERRAQYEPRWRAALANFDEDELRTTASVLDALAGLFGEFLDD